MHDAPVPDETDPVVPKVWDTGLPERTGEPPRIRAPRAAELVKSTPHKAA